MLEGGLASTADDAAMGVDLDAMGISLVTEDALPWSAAAADRGACRCAGLTTPWTVTRWPSTVTSSSATTSAIARRAIVAATFAALCMEWDESLSLKTVAISEWWRCTATAGRVSQRGLDMTHVPLARDEGMVVAEL